MKYSPISNAGKLDLWLELEDDAAGWEERVTGALIIQGTRGREHVAHAEVRLISPPVSLSQGKLFSVDLDSADWHNFLIGAEDQLRLPFSVTIPWGLAFHPYADLVGKVTNRPGVYASVGSAVRALPPTSFRRVAQAFSGATALVVNRWWITEDGEGAAVRLTSPRAGSAALESAELQLRYVDEELLTYLQVEWLGTGIAGLWNGRGLPRKGSFRFPVPHQSDEQTERFFREELLPALAQRPSGSLPLPAQFGGTVEDQLPRIVPEAQPEG